MLAVVAVIAAERLMAMHQIIAGIDIEDDLLGCRAAGADKQVDQVRIEDLDAAGLGGADLLQDGAFFQRISFAKRGGLWGRSTPTATGTTPACST